MESKKSWLRPTQLTKKFPQNKYRFDEVLKNVGDYVETYPMSLADYERFNKAAHHWAWYRGYRVSVKTIKHHEDQTYTVICTLTSKVRIRDYK